MCYDPLGVWPFDVKIIQKIKKKTTTNKITTTKQNRR